MKYAVAVVAIIVSTTAMTVSMSAYANDVNESLVFKYDSRTFKDWAAYPGKEVTFAKTSATNTREYTIGFRCSDNDEYSDIIVTDFRKGFNKGQTYNVRYQVDSHPVKTATFNAINASLISNSGDMDLFKSMLDGINIKFEFNQSGVTEYPTFSLRGMAKSWTYSKIQCRTKRDNNLNKGFIE